MSREKKISRHHHPDTQKSVLSDNDFKAAIMKMIQEGRANTLEINIGRNYQQINRKSKQEPNRNFRTKN